MYQVIVSIHILSSFLLFALWFYEWLNNIVYLPKVNFTQQLQRLQMVTMVIVVGTGIYMMRYAWGPQPWLIIAIILVILTIIFSVSFIIVDKILLKKNTKLNFIYLSFKESFKIGSITSIICLMSFKTQHWSLILYQTLVALIGCFLITMIIKSKFIKA